MNLVGNDEKKICFILNYSHILKESYLDDLNSMINNGEIHGIHNKEESENIVTQAKSKILNDDVRA
jgi:hypothetical protein